MRDAHAVVNMLGARLRREPTGWRDCKALVLLVALSGPWTAAGVLADALGVDEEQQETIYREAQAARPDEASNQ